jgi:RHH-type rel operon transcriptional repressor/antitoxin RelB
MLALRLPPEIERRLDALAKKTGRSKSYYAREAILRQIEDIEDDYLARRRLARGGPRVTLESLERDFQVRALKAAPSPPLPRKRGREPSASKRTKR